MTTVYNRFLAITKSDTVDLAPWSAEQRLTDAIQVGGAGVVAAVDANNVAVSITCVAGQLLPIAIRRVNDANTTATVMTALYAQ